VGHFVWELLANENENVGGPDFVDHLQACREYIAQIREIAPDFDLYWKSGTALQLHAVNGVGWFKIQRVFYLSTYRAQHLYDEQVQLMHELGVPVLDMYRLTYLSADWLRKGDGRHYENTFMKRAIRRFFYPSLDSR